MKKYIYIYIYVYTPENSHDIGNSLFSTGDTSSNGWFPNVMLVFSGCICMQNKKTTVIWSPDRSLVFKNQVDRNSWSQWIIQMQHLYIIGVPSALAKRPGPKRKVIVKSIFRVYISFREGNFASPCTSRKSLQTIRELPRLHSYYSRLTINGVRSCTTWV